MMTKKNKRKNGPKREQKPSKSSKSDERSRPDQEQKDVFDSELSKEYRVQVGGQWKKCPRCGTFDTTAASTRGEIMVEGKPFILQVRKCRRAICRASFKALKPN